jgi:hypothetical protein
METQGNSTPKGVGGFHLEWKNTRPVMGKDVNSASATVTSTLSGGGRDSLLALLEAGKRDDIRYKLNPAIFVFIKDMFEDTYGTLLTRDVFASRTAQSQLQGNWKEDALFLAPKWEALQDVVNWVSEAKVLAVIVAPSWTHHIWHKQLCDKATHKLLLCLEDGTYINNNGLPTRHEGTRIEGFFVDARYERRVAEKAVVIKVPNIKECSARTPAPP